MRTYAESRQVHSTLRNALSPWFRERGWERRKGSSCAFLKLSQSGDGFWCFWLQVSQWGGRDFGNEFTVNLILLPSASDRPYGGPYARVLKTLPQDDRDIGLALEAKIAARVPKPPPESRICQWMDLPGEEGATFKRMWAEAFVPHPHRWAEDMDVWLRYFAVDDVEEWASFLVPRLELLTAQVREHAA